MDSKTLVESNLKIKKRDPMQTLHDGFQFKIKLPMIIGNNERSKNP